MYAIFSDKKTKHNHKKIPIKCKVKRTTWQINNIHINNMKYAVRLKEYLQLYMKKKMKKKFKLISREKHFS